MSPAQIKVPARTPQPLSKMGPEPVPFHAEVIQCGLQDRVLGGLVDLHVRSWWVILLDSGQAVITRENGSTPVTGPALLWLPWDRSQRIRAKAGTVGGHLVMGETALANAIGVKPEAADLRVLASRAIHLQFEERTALHRDFAACFDLILREAAGNAPGSATVIEAQVRVMLVMLWRHAARPDDLRQAKASTSLILQQFRQTLETHFRDRWTVARYADALNTSTDRLHDICQRTLGKPPLRLIHERLGYEAQVLLERSSMTLDQIAEFLGFRSAAHFSSFFKSLRGIPPGAWRRQTRSAGDKQGPRVRQSYADWP
ncbi:helix-turn-helix domain-containing protein [Plastorhodobacter daqingensis]|uniref:Helix-turn-helix domain-containing protein n=1 Tax=Plastorhodobacter daqingensis TaxID=1387281 RepID=A0ABW2ULB4_9RHOB